MYKNLLSKYRYSLILLRQLVITEFKLRYQGSALGYLWSLMKPLFLFLIMYVVFVYFLRVGDGVPHWPVQLLLGIVIWNFFAEVTNNGVVAVVSRGDIMRKINFPKYIIVLASTISAGINFLINLVVVIIFMLVSGVEFRFEMLLAPVYILELTAFALGLAFFMSALFVKLRDINYIWEIVMQGLFYASIVIYPITMLLNRGREFAELLLLNPVAQVIQNVRQAMVSGEADTLLSISGNWVIALIPVVLSIVVLLLGAWYFKKQSPYFAENV